MKETQDGAGEEDRVGWGLVPRCDSLCDQFASVRDAPGATLGRTLLG